MICPTSHKRWDRRTGRDRSRPNGILPLGIAVVGRNLHDCQTPTPLQTMLQMSTKNSKRFDLSDYLIHFFRKVDIASDSAPVVPESMGFANLHEDEQWSAIFMLRCAIRHQLLWATWSYRGGARTIYGRSPAVCFTEMPLAAFLEAGNDRSLRGEAMSSYALVFPKNGLYNYGANPVIYGLDTRSAYIPNGRDGEARIIDESLLPLREQYRYVTFNPSAKRPIDWTHEREWRWPCRDVSASIEEQIEEFGCIEKSSDIPGMSLSSSWCRGMGVVVKSDDEASWVISDILSLVDRDVVDRWHFSFVLVSARLLPGGIVQPDDVESAISEASIDLDPFFSIKDKDARLICERFTELVWHVERSHSLVQPGECGGAWLWILDNTSRLARALLKTGRVQVSKDGRYLAELKELNDSRSLRQREEMIESLAVIVTREFGVECGTFSVRDSDNFDDVPFYSSEHAENGMFFNVSW